MDSEIKPFFDPRIEGRHIIRTDPHCHILPGLDDGAPNLDMSLRMARRMVQAGIERVIASPHGAHPGIDTNTDPDFLREQVAQLNEALQAEGIPLTVYPGTEVFLRRRIMDLFDAGKLMTWADQGRFILVELGFQGKSSAVLDVVDHLLDAGVIPIIAHPERYLWLPQEPGLFEELRDRGCVFQFNTMSLNGHFGPRIQQLALRLIVASPSFIIGTDSHHDADRYFDLKAIRRRLEELGLFDRATQEAVPAKSPAAPDLANLP